MDENFDEVSELLFQEQIGLKALNLFVIELEIDGKVESSEIFPVSLHATTLIGDIKLRSLKISGSEH